MYRFCRLALNFDPARLQADLRAAEQPGWQAHFVPSNYTGDWSVIALRSVAGQVGHIFSDHAVAPDGYADTPLVAQCAYFREVLAAFLCPLTSVRLMKLAAGSTIKEHRDHDLTVDGGTVRLHIPVVTNPLVAFHVEGERVVMREGECWYIDASLPHWLANHGEADRVHLVLDCIVNDWLRGLLDQAGYAPRPLDFFEVRGIRRSDLDQVIRALRDMGSPVSLQHADELEQARAQGL